ncbi:MAG: PKD domain-containing protein [Chitinophagales bacterium]
MQLSTACKGSTNVYTVYPNLPGYTYQWTITGGTPVSYTGNPVTVTWGNGGNALIKVVISQNSGNCRDSFQTQLCLKDGPVANFTITSSPSCVGQPVTFNNTGTGGVTFVWNFGDGNSYSGFNPPPHVYSTPGTYIVTLLASSNPLTAQPGSQDCHCRDIKSDTLIIGSGTGPKIDTLGCYGSLCSTDTPLRTAYSTPLICGTYNWTVNGGTIISGAGTSSIVVQWNPSFSGTPTVTLSVPASCAGGCASSTTITVPIIYPNLPIQGPASVCVGSTSSYSLPVLPGCYYSWTITGNGNFTPSNNNYNSAVAKVIAGNFPGSFTLNCTYYDSLKHCGGSSSWTVQVLDKFLISAADLKVCEQATGNYFASGPASWQVFQNGILVPSYVIPNGSSASIFWLTPGTYQVVATSLNPLLYCNSSYSATVVVAARPVLTTSQALNSNVCSGDLITYQVNSTHPDYPFNWSISGGTIMANDGDNVTVQWTSGGTISVYQSNPDPSLICPSNTLTFTATPFAAPNITGAATACEDDVVNYNATPAGMPDYQWTIIGGTITGGQGSSAISVLWAGGTGVHSLTVSTCSGSSTKTVFITNKTTYSVTYTAGAGCSYTLTSTATAPTYSWYLNGTPLAPNTQTISITASGYYMVQPNIPCTKASGIAVTLPAIPQVTITTPVSRFCSPGGSVALPAITFNSIISAGGPYTYQWYHTPSPGAIPGANSAVYTQPAGLPSTSMGSYSLVVGYGSGCTVSSNVVVIDTGCGSGGGGTPCTLPSPPYSLTVSKGCNGSYLESFSSPPPAGTSINWNFGDGNTAISSVGAGVTHSFLNPGIYSVCATASNSTFCDLTSCIMDTIPIAPSFSVNIGCTAATLTNTSQMLSGISGYTISWSASSGTISPTGPNTATFTGSGTVTMTISYHGCNYVVSQNVNVVGTSVTISNPATSCLADQNLFTTTPSGFAVYNWNFGDATTSGLAAPVHGYSNSGIFNITVTAVDYNGCTATGTSQIQIFPLPVVVLTTSDTFICKGDSAQLTATAGFNNYVWFRAGVQIATGTSNTLFVSQTGMYTVLVTDGNGCSSKSNRMPIVVRPLPKFKINFPPPNSSIVCVNATQPGTTTVAATYNSNFIYNWYASAPVSIASPNASSTTVNIAAATPAGNYPIYLTVTDTITGCSKSDTVCLTVSLAPSVVITPNASVCAGNPTVLNAIPNAPIFSYNWNTGASTPSITVSAAGNYQVTITANQSGCSAVSNSVIVYPIPDVSLFPTGCDTLCDKDHLYIPLPNQLNPVAPSSVYDTIQWFVNGNPFSQGPFLPLSSLTPGNNIIHVSVHNTWGCTNTTDDYFVFVKHCPDTCIVQAIFTNTLHGDTAQFHNASSGNGMLSYLWVFSDGDTSHQQNPAHVFDTTGVQSVCLHVTNNNPNGSFCEDSFCICVCICHKDSGCSAFLSYLQNQNITVNGTLNPTFTFTPPVLQPTDVVRWDYTCDGIIDAVTTGNSTATHTYGASGNYVVCAKIERIVDGDTCWARLTAAVKADVSVACHCDSTFLSAVNAGYATSVSGNMVTFIPLALTNCDTVEWNFGDGSPLVYTVGNTAVSHTYANPHQQYYVCMLVRRAGSPNCTREFCRATTVSGINQIPAGDLRIYPNPSQDFWFIEWNHNQYSETYFAAVSDPAGRVLLKQHLSSEKTTRISCENFSSGCYLLSITNASGQTVSNYRISKY